MRFFWIFLLIASFVLARPAVPPSEQQMVLDKTSSEDWVESGSTILDGICPNLKVRCVKDGKWPSGIVGDVSRSSLSFSYLDDLISSLQIGSQPFCRMGIRCNQCDEEKNTFVNSLYINQSGLLDDRICRAGSGAIGCLRSARIVVRHLHQYPSNYPVCNSFKVVSVAYTFYWLLKHPLPQVQPKTLSW